MTQHIINFTLNPSQHGDNRLDKLLKNTLNTLKQNQLSRARIQSLIKNNHLTLNNQTITDPATQIRSEINGTLTIPPAIDAKPQPQNIKLNIVFEDKHLIVINKPAGMVTHPAAGNYNNTLVNALLYHCQENNNLSEIGGYNRPGIVHRLDKDTSGLLVIAKNDETHHNLAQQFAEHSIGRTYKALVKGIPKPLSGTINKPISRDPNNRKKMHTNNPQGKYAVTHYNSETIFAPYFTLISCQLQTGRTHQIRTHLASINHPLVGDKVYGRSQAKINTKKLTQQQTNFIQQFPRQALHAETLAFTHPINSQIMNFTSQIPEDFTQLLEICSILNQSLNQN